MGQCPVPPPARGAPQRPGQSELRAGEALVFDWTSLGFCCAVAGEINLRPTTLQEANAHRPMCRSRAGRVRWCSPTGGPTRCWSAATSEVDCRRRLGVRSFSSSLPPDLGLRTSFGRETG